MISGSISTWSVEAWLALLFGGIACGFLNTLAGGGSLITLPLLIFLGLPPILANATNRLAITIQYATAAFGFWASGVRQKTSMRRLLLPGLLGAAVGSWLAVVIDPLWFRFLLGWLMLLAVIPTLSPATWAASKTPDGTPRRPRRLLIPVFFFIGLYSGFLQAGIGIWSLLALLRLGQYEVNEANAIKAQLLFFFAFLSTLFFLAYDQILFAIGIVLALANAVGSLAATYVSKRYSLAWLRWLVLFVVILSSFKLLGVF